MTSSSDQKTFAKLAVFALISSFLIAQGPQASATVGGNSNCETASFSSGDGSQGNPWRIGTVDQLRELGDCKSLTHYYRLTGNLDLGGTGNPWTPLADVEFNGFKGNLDGAGFEISGLYSKTSDRAGLFGYLDANSSVVNLSVVNATVSGEVAGALAAFAEDRVKLENVSASGVVSGRGSNLEASVFAGGIVGRLAWRASTDTSSSTVSNLTFVGRIINSAGVGLIAGGLFGAVGNSSTFGSPSRKIVTIISSSAKTKFLSLQSAGNGEFFGGLIGTSHNARIWGSAAEVSTELYSSVDFGGLVGLAESTEISKCSVKGIVYAASGSPSIGGISNNLRDDERANYVNPLIENCIVNLGVHLETTSGKFAGLVYYLQNGVLSKNIAMSSLISSGTAKGLVYSTYLTTGGSRDVISYNNNLFDSSNTNITVAADTSLTSGQAQAVSTSSLSQLATLTAAGLDTSSVWDVNGLPQLIAVTESRQIFNPVSAVARSGSTLQIYAGTPVSSSLAIDSSDFVVTVDGITDVILSAGLSPTNSRVIDLELATPIASLQNVRVNYSQDNNPALNYALSVFPSATYLPSFEAEAINKVAVASPSPTSNTLAPTQVQSYERTTLSFTGQNLAEATVQMKPLSSGGYGSVEVVTSNATGVQFKTPTLSASTANREYLVRITTKGGSVVLSNTVTYLGSPSISAVTPNVGGRGTLVEIQGNNLASTTTVSFGVTEVSVASTTSTSVTVVAPTGTPGQTVNIVAKGPGWTSTLTNRFQFTQSPSISSISIATGSTAGGETVEITGVTLSNLIEVKFGALAATIVSSSSTSVQVVTPVASAGTVDVSVRTTGGLTTLVAAYTFVNPTPPVNNSSANTGGSSGGSSSVSYTGPEIIDFSIRIIYADGGKVTITGKRLGSISAMKLGGVSVALIDNTDTSATFETSDLPIGVWDLYLANSYGQLTFQQAIQVITPQLNSAGELLGYKWTLKFTGNSRVLNSYQTEALKTIAKKYGNAETVVCWGYTTAETPKQWAITHATARAEAACSLIAKQLGVKTVVRLRYGVEKSWAMRAALQFWKQEN